MTAPPAIVAEGASFAYGGIGKDVGPFSAMLREGELLLLTGPSGSGKSTLARMLGGLIPHLYRGRFTGRIVVGGVETVRQPLWKVAEQVGLVLQNPENQLLARTVETEIAFGLENLGLSVGAISDRVAAVVDRFGLGHLRHRDPRSLSGGEQQRLVIAAAWARRPRALILDEPLSMLDAAGAGAVVAALAEVRKDGVSVGVVEHRPARFAAAPEVRHLCIAADGPYDDPLPPLPGIAGGPRLLLGGVSCAIADRQILDGIDLSLVGGEVVGVVGPNGSGKTTLLRAIAGLQPHRGRVEGFVGTWRRQLGVGLCFQNPDRQLFNPTVRDEIRYGRAPIDEERYRAVICALGLERYEQTPPLLLSEGEKKRLTLATVLMLPRIEAVCLDEPTLGQDVRHRRLVGRVARALAQAGYICVVASHDEEWVSAWCDRVFRLRGGRVESVECGVVGHARRRNGRDAPHAAGVQRPSIDSREVAMEAFR